MCHIFCILFTQQQAVQFQFRLRFSIRIAITTASEKSPAQQIIIGWVWDISSAVDIAVPHVGGRIGCLAKTPGLRFRFVFTPKRLLEHWIV